MYKDRPAVVETRTVPGLHPREEVLSKLENLILQQKLRAGDSLPDEDVLARALGLSVFQVRDGISALAALGILDVQPDGTRMIGRQEGSARPDLLRLQMSLTEFPTQDLLDVRLQLETCAARRAAIEATPAQLGCLHKLVQAMCEPHISRERFTDLDDRFHAGITEATTNALGAELMHALRDAFAEVRTAAFAQITDWRSTQHDLIAEHRHILTALANGEGEEAAAQLHHHIADFYAASA